MPLERWACRAVGQQAAASPAGLRLGLRLNCHAGHTHVNIVIVPMPFDEDRKSHCLDGTIWRHSNWSGGASALALAIGACAIATGC